MSLLALALAVIAIPFCVWLWRDVKRSIAQSLTEDDVRLGIRPRRTIDVWPAGDPDPDRPYNDSVMERKFGRNPDA